MAAKIYPMNLLPMENEVTEIALSLQQAVPGYGFRPSAEVLINYLKSEVPGWRGSVCIIPTLDNIYKINPWDLPQKFNGKYFAISKRVPQKKSSSSSPPFDPKSVFNVQAEKSAIPSADQEWWFIRPQTKNQRISRKTPCGSSWKITGNPTDIKARNEGKKIGSKIKLVFIDGRNSKGAKSNWVMHELHPDPDNTGFVLCWLKRKQDEKADNLEPSIQVGGNQPNDAAMVKNDGIPSIPRFQCPEVVVSELSEQVYSKSDGSYQHGTKFIALINEDNHHFSPNQERFIWTENSLSTANSSESFLAVSEPTNHNLNFPHHFLNDDGCRAIQAEEEYTNQLKAGMSGTSNFMGEQADKSWDSTNCANPEQLPFAEHRVQDIQNQLNELITNGSSSSTEVSSGSHSAVTTEWSSNEPWMSPCDRDSFPNHELFDLSSLFGEPEVEMGEIQYGQLGESTSCDNNWANKRCWPGHDIQQGRAPLQEEKRFVKPKLSHPWHPNNHNGACVFFQGEVTPHVA